MKSVLIIVSVFAIALACTPCQLVASAEASATPILSGGDAALKQLPSWWTVKADNGNGAAEEQQWDDDDDDDGDYDEDKNGEEEETVDQYERMWNSVTLG